MLARTIIGKCGKKKLFIENFALIPNFQSSALERDVYEFPWYDLDKKNKNLFRIFYAHVQMPLQLKSPPFITLNMAYYHEVC